MKRIFYHINEFRDEGMRQLPILACLCDPLIIYAPSARLLRKAHSEGKTILSPEGLLAVLRQSDDPPVRIMARKWWLFDKKRRNQHDFPGAKWDDKLVGNFDDAIKEMAEQDEERGKPARRVIIAKDEEGWDKAQEFLEGPDGTNTAQQLRELYKQQKLPPGILEKARKADEKNESVPKVILRDTFNHEYAIVDAGASGAATPSEYMHPLHEMIGPLSPK